jgi:methylenetetrahydrofolate dehydrogenase (NADP+)/methenyltetrahydrofolate cyclohydrolase
MILNGKTLSEQIRAEIRAKVMKYDGRKPGLAFLLVGDHPASLAYVSSKKKACAEVGIHSKMLEFSQSISQSDLIAEIERLNRDPEIDGILVQLPLPPHISESDVAFAIAPEKDVDGFHPMNAGKLLLGEETGFIPCTPKGIHVLLKRNNIPIEGRHVVIVGRSNLVGKPLAALLVQKQKDCNATVTLTHSRTKNIGHLTSQADILVAAIGHPRFIKREMVRPGATVIDVGINRLADGRMVGDVDFDSVSEIASHITPVPGGVGPMTIAMLLENTIQSFEKRGIC